MADNSPTFQRWETAYNEWVSPEGTADGVPIFSRPFGTNPSIQTVPNVELKRWAIIGLPSGMKTDPGDPGSNAYAPPWWVLSRCARLILPVCLRLDSDTSKVLK